jgi:tetratricopeptide (TPR) repeat protein
MDKPLGAPLTSDLAREICERTNGTAVLEGSISRLGSQYVLSLRARNCRTGNMLDEQQEQPARKEDVLNVLTQIAGKFRTRAGESLAAVRRHETPLMEATTRSIEALKAYSASFKFAHSPDPSAAVPLLKHAIELDPNFTMAYAFLGRLRRYLSDGLAAENVSKAYALRNRTSERERFFVNVSYDVQVTENLEQAFRDSVSFAATYPRDREAHAGLSGICQWLGKYPKAIEAGNRASEIDPDFAPGPVNAAWSYIFVNRLPEAEAVLRKTVARKLEFPDLFLLSYYIAFLKGDQPAMERAAAAASDKPGAEDWMLSAQASVSAYSGRLQQSRTMIRRAMDLALQGKQPARAAMYQAGAAVREAFFGNAIEARRNAMAALQLSQSRDVEYGAAF